MLPEEFPPELMDALGGAEEEPDEIEVNAPEGAETDADLIREAIELLQEAAQNESDDADSAVLTKIVADLYKLTAGQQDAEMTAMGGNPKQMRSLSKAYGG